jgi:hypothetical protein
VPSPLLDIGKVLKSFMQAIGKLLRSVALAHLDPIPHVESNFDRDGDRSPQGKVKRHQDGSVPSEPLEWRRQRAHHGPVELVEAKVAPQLEDGVPLHLLSVFEKEWKNLEARSHLERYFRKTLAVVPVLIMRPPPDLVGVFAIPRGVLHDLFDPPRDASAPVVFLEHRYGRVAASWKQTQEAQPWGARQHHAVNQSVDDLSPNALPHHRPDKHVGAVELRVYAQGRGGQGYASLCSSSDEKFSEEAAIHLVTFSWRTQVADSHAPATWF